MSNFSPADKEQLAKLLSEKIKVYGQIRKMTEEQSGLLDKDDIEAFNVSLNKREKLIEKINGLHQDSDTLMQSYVTFSSASSGGDKEINKLRNDIHDALKACAELNDKNIASLQSKSESQKERINKQSAKRKGIGGYAQSVPNVPEMFDKKS